MRLPAVAAFVGLLSLVGGCGYQQVYGGARPVGRLSLAMASSREPEGGAATAMMAGARAELAHSGLLASGNGYPRLVVELVRVDERGAGQRMTPNLTLGEAAPLARGGLVGVVGRAWIEERAGAEPASNTGDVRRASSFAAEAGPGLDALSREDSLSHAGRELGRALVKRLLGEPEPTEEAF